MPPKKITAKDNDHAQEEPIPKLTFKGKKVTPDDFGSLFGRKYYSLDEDSRGFDRGYTPEKLVMIKENNKGFGLYAAEKFNAGEEIRPYLGEIIGLDILTQGAERNRDVFYPFDASSIANESVLINHGVPNIAPVVEYTKDGQVSRVVFVALRDIKYGEEFLFNYGSAYAFKTLEVVDLDALSKQLVLTHKHIRFKGFLETIKKDLAVCSSGKMMPPEAMEGMNASMEMMVTPKELKEDPQLLLDLRYFNILGYAFLRPLVLIRLKQKNVLGHIDLKFLWDYFCSSDAYRKLRGESYHWINITLAHSLMQINDTYYKIFDEVIKKHLDLSQSPQLTYDEFLNIKYKFYALLLDASVTYGQVDSLAADLISCILHGKKFIVSQDYSTYFKTIRPYRNRFKLLDKVSQQLPLFAEDLSKQGINVKQFLVDGINMILPKDIMNRLRAMINEGKLKNLYRLAPEDHEYYALVSVRLKNKVIEQVSGLAKENDVMVEIKPAKKSESSLVYFAKR
ncbi:MAG TPA: SET domain-containing protein [Gammaproteobacteria bacterium]|nr:SET domain-containing protein [Gammaproteobacteria bacterium]